MFESSPTQSLKTDPKMTRKVRVIFQDPYATDSSSSEDECEVMTPVKKPQKSKPIVREISLPVPGLPQAIAIQSESSSQDSNSRSGTNRKRVMSKSPEGTPKPKKPTGIRQRKWGKWAVEIRSPIDKKRVWVGTYLTLEEATEAYNAKKLEFETILAASSGKTGTIASSAAAAASKNESASSTSEESESVVSISHTSPSAVPEIDTSASAPMLINDVTIDPIPECFDTNFDGIPISDIFFADEPLFPGSVDLAAQFDDFIVSNDFESLLGDYCGIEDLNISGIQGDEPSDLPDYDFNTDEFLLAADAPLNIACL